MNEAKSFPLTGEPKSLTEIDGTTYIWYKNNWKNYEKYRLKHRRKKFVRLVKRSVAGPIAGLFLAIVAYQAFKIHWLACVGIGLAATAVGLYLRFRYVKYVYLAVVSILYLFLLALMVLK